MHHRAIIRLAVVLSLGSLAACIPPRVLVSEEIAGGRSVKYTLQRSREGEHPKYDLAVRVCDFDNSGHEVNCADTLLLTDVAWRIAPRQFF